ncbi:hypothetical protein N8459_02750, partial [Nitrosopumilus sp.]|nr:hypothetical protein [Nitrosopumilus sp.]
SIVGQFRNFFSINRNKYGTKIIAIGNNSTVLGIGNASGTYEFRTDISKYCHTVPVEWNDTKNRQISTISTFNNSVKEIDVKEYLKIIQEDLTKEHEEVKYFLLRHNVDGTWKDDLGKKYHFGKTVPNHIPLRNAGVGTKTIWFTKQSGEFYFWGYGTVKEIETIQENLEWNLVYDNFKYFVRNYDTSIAVRGKFLKQGNSSIKQQIENVPKYNKQTTMFIITKKIYDQILSQDLSQNNGGSTY